MKKPKKKEVPECLNDLTIGNYEEGFNEACDEWEKFYIQEKIKTNDLISRIYGMLPDEKEIFKMITENILMYDYNRQVLAKAIYERISGEE